MSMKKRFICLLAAAVLAVSMFGCGQEPDVPEQPAESAEPAAEMPPLPEASAEAEPDCEEELEEDEPDDEPDPEDDEPDAWTFDDEPGALVEETVENIRFSYWENMKHTDPDGLVNYYFNETCFFFLESGPIGENPFVTAGEWEFDQALAEEFYAATLESFGLGAWKNPAVTTDVTQITINDLDVWIFEFDVERAREGDAYACSMATTCLDGVLTTFLFLADNASYHAYIESFAEVLFSMQAA